MSRARERAHAALAAVEASLAGLPTGEAHREVLTRHLAAGRALAGENPHHAALQLTALVHAACTGAEAPAPLVASNLLVFLGADLLDDIADGELPDGWEPAVASLAATTLLCVATRAALAALDTTPERKVELSRCLDAALLDMSAGQHADLTSTPADPAAARAIAERKAGAEFALFARSAALLAGSDRVDAYDAFGRDFGTAAQLASDLASLDEDLAAGRHTLAVTHLAARGEPTDGPAAELRARLVEAGSIRFAALVVAVYRQRAIEALEAAAPAQPYGDELRALLDEATTLSPQASRPRERRSSASRSAAPASASSGL